MDLISRQDAIDAIVAWTVEDRPDVEMPTDLIDRIKALPSEQPEKVCVAEIKVDGEELQRCVDRAVVQIKKENRQKTPCDLCRHNPPSSGDGKPCSYCPAEGEWE